MKRMVVNTCIFLTDNVATYSSHSKETYLQPAMVFVLKSKEVVVRAKQEGDFNDDVVERGTRTTRPVVDTKKARVLT